MVGLAGFSDVLKHRIVLIFIVSIFLRAFGKYLIADLSSNPENF